MSALSWLHYFTRMTTRSIATIQITKTKKILCAQSVPAGVQTEALLVDGKSQAIVPLFESERKGVKYSMSPCDNPRSLTLWLLVDLTSSFWFLPLYKQNPKFSKLKVSCTWKKVKVQITLWKKKKTPPKQRKTLTFSKSLQTESSEETSTLLVPSGDCTRKICENGIYRVEKVSNHRERKIPPRFYSNRASHAHGPRDAAKNIRLVGAERGRARRPRKWNPGGQKVREMEKGKGIRIWGTYDLPGLWHFAGGVISCWVVGCFSLCASLAEKVPRSLAVPSDELKKNCRVNLRS